MNATLCGLESIALLLVRLSLLRFMGTPLADQKSMPSKADNGIVTIAAHQNVDQTVAKLEKILEAKGVKMFSIVDHNGEAEKAGLEMLPTKLLIFGNPKAGTPLMIASPSAALDLPLKVLVAEMQRVKSGSPTIRPRTFKSGTSCHLI